MRGRVVRRRDESFLVLRWFLQRVSKGLFGCQRTYYWLGLGHTNLLERRILELDRTLNDRSQPAHLVLELSDPPQERVHHITESRRRRVQARLELLCVFHFRVPFLRDFGDFPTKDDDEFLEF